MQVLDSREGKLPTGVREGQGWLGLSPGLLLLLCLLWLVVLGFFESLFVASGLEVVVLRCLVFFGFWSGVMSLFFVDFSVFSSLGLLFWDIEVTLYCGRG